MSPLPFTSWILTGLSSWQSVIYSRQLDGPCNYQLGTVFAGSFKLLVPFLLCLCQIKTRALEWVFRITDEVTLQMCLTVLTGISCGSSCAAALAGLFMQINSGEVLARDRAVSYLSTSVVELLPEVVHPHADLEAYILEEGKAVSGALTAALSLRWISYVRVHVCVLACVHPYMDREGGR